jgi:hypothetical protein
MQNQRSLGRRAHSSFDSNAGAESRDLVVAPAARRPFPIVSGRQQQRQRCHSPIPIRRLRFADLRGARAADDHGRSIRVGRFRRRSVRVRRHKIQPILSARLDDLARSLGDGRARCKFGNRGLGIAGNRDRPRRREGVCSPPGSAAVTVATEAWLAEETSQRCREVGASHGTLQRPRRCS